MKYKVKLTECQRKRLLEMVNTGKEKARMLTHARVLLQADASKSGPALKAKVIAKHLNIHERTVHRIRERFANEGLESALNRKAHSRHKPKRLDGDQEAQLIALCCGAKPEGRTSWTLDLLSDELVKLNIVAQVSRSTVRRVLKKTNLSLG